MTNSIVLVNTNTGSRININTSWGEYWLDSVDWGTVESNNHTFKYVDQIGVTLYNTTLEPRQVMITGWVAREDESEVRRMKQILNSIVNPKHTLQAIRGNYKIEFVPRTSVKYSATYKENNEYMAKFLITGYCPYPLFTDLYDNVVSVAYTESRFHFPLTIPKDTGVIMGVRQPSLIAEINNPGDFPVGYTIEFRATGTVVNPSLVDIGSQEFIKIGKTLESGEVVRIYTQEGQRHIVGILKGIESNYFHYRTYDSSWLRLAVGQNLLRYDAEEGLSSLEVVITFNPGYLEVEE